MKRHESLIPLSREHHEALLLAQRIKQGKSKSPQSDWPETRELQRDRAMAFFDTELVFHFRAEEEFLFPLAERYLPPKVEILPLLRKHHSQIRDLIERLRQAKGVQLENLLLRFAQVLEEHVRKEERVFFQRIQREIPEEELLECGKRIESYLQAAKT